MSTPTPSPPNPLRILLLHGFTQSPPLFHAKTRALHKALQRSFPTSTHTLHLTYAPAPHKLPLADIPGHNPDLPASEAPDAYGWWRRKDNTNGTNGGIVYEGLEEGMDAIAKCIREEGPFKGVVGFSQGAAAAAMVASLLEGTFRLEAFGGAEEGGGMAYPSSFLAEDGEGEGGFVQGPLKFAVCYSGFRAPGILYRAFYEPRIRTRVLHVLGQVDVVVDEVRGRELVRACEGGDERVVVHPGGHFVPSQKPWLDAVVGFVKECVEGGEDRREEKEVAVEDMEVPF